MPIYCPSAHVFDEHQFFKTIYEEHYDALYKNIKQFISSDEQIKDLLQNVFLKFWMTRDQWPEIFDVKSYLFTMSRNAAISYLRKAKRKKQRLTNQEMNQSTYYYDDETIKREFQNLINRTINTLSPQQQLVYRLKNENGLKSEGIAQALRLQKSTVMVHMKMARKKMKALVQKRMTN